MNSSSTVNKETAALTRRKLLYAASAAGAVGLAGCSSIANQSYTASDVTMGSAGTDLGFEQGEGKTFTNRQERSVGPISGSVTAESKLTVFADAESTPDPTEEERWADSDSAMAQWSENTPVQAVRGSDVIDGDGILPAEGDQFDLLPAASTTLLVPETDGDTDRVLALAPMADIEFGDRQTDGTVNFDPPVSGIEGESFAPAGLAFAPEDDA